MLLHNWVTIKVVFVHSGWYAEALHEVVMGIATPTMERYTLGPLGIMMSVIVWPDT